MAKGKIDKTVHKIPAGPTEASSVHIKVKVQDKPVVNTTLTKKPFLFASVLPKLQVPSPSRSHNLESKLFDEVHEFVV